MKALRNYLNKVKPNFEEGGKLHAFRSVFDGFETFLYVPNDTAKAGGVNIHDAIDSKRIMSMVVIALMPAMLFGMYNIGYQNYLAAGTLASASFWEIFCFGFLAVLPKILVSYIVGLGIEFAWAQWKGEEIQEGYLVSGIIIPLIIPIGCPLWMLALACAFSVIFCKEIFGGTGMNIFNPAIAARMFLFFAYPAKMTGDQVWVAQDSIFGLGNTLPDGFTAATPLGQMAQGINPDASICDMICGFIPGSIGETSLYAIAIGAVILLVTGIASWRTMLSVFVGGAALALLFQSTGSSMEWWHHFVMGGFAFGAVFMATDPVTSCRTTTGQYIYGLGGALMAIIFEQTGQSMTWWHHFVLGGFAFGAVFMATDPVTSCRTSCGQYIYGFLIGAMAIIIRVMNAGYPEGMMLAIFFGNMFAPTIDHFVVARNISKRAKRGGTK